MRALTKEVASDFWTEERVGKESGSLRATRRSSSGGDSGRAE